MKYVLLSMLYPWFLWFRDNQQYDLLPPAHILELVYSRINIGPGICTNITEISYYW
jgi:hypothetical protein